MFFLLARGSASALPPMQRRRNLEKSAVPTLLVPGSRPDFHATMCRTAGDLGACWNRILTIFDPYTFSRSQGHQRRLSDVHCWSASLPTLTVKADIAARPPSAK